MSLNHSPKANPVPPAEESLLRIVHGFRRIQAEQNWTDNEVRDYAAGIFGRHLSEALLGEKDRRRRPRA